jgi:hypothetical protein
LLARYSGAVLQGVGCGLGIRGTRSDLTRCLQHGVGDRADMRMDSLQVAKHVQMQRARLDTLRSSLAQPGQMMVGGGKLRAPQRGLLGKELTGVVDVPGHERAERKSQALENALVEGGELFRALT